MGDVNPSIRLAGDDLLTAAEAALLASDDRPPLPPGVRFRPTGCRIAVRLDARRGTFVQGALHPASSVTATSGLIIAPDEYAETPCTGVVVAVGPGIHESPMWHLELAPGKRVQFGKYNGVALDPSYFDAPGEYVVLDARHDKPKPHVPEVYGELINEAAVALGRVAASGEDLEP